MCLLTLSKFAAVSALESSIKSRALRLIYGGVLFLALSPAIYSQGTGEKNAYRLCPGDQVQIEVIHEPDLSIAQAIDPKGIVTIPLIGTLELTGLTLAEANDVLEKAFRDKHILISPQVSVSIIKYAEKTFYIFGSVNNPGAKSLPPGKDSIDLLQAISLGGELSQYAKRREIRIQSTTESGKQTTAIVDLEHILEGVTSVSKPQYQIQAGDLIFVPERMF